MTVHSDNLVRNTNVQYQFKIVIRVDNLFTHNHTHWYDNIPVYQESNNWYISGVFDTKHYTSTLWFNFMLLLLQLPLMWYATKQNRWCLKVHVVTNRQMIISDIYLIIVLFIYTMRRCLKHIMRTAIKCLIRQNIHYG